MLNNEFIRDEVGSRMEPMKVTIRALIAAKDALPHGDNVSQADNDIYHMMGYQHKAGQIL